VTPAAVAALGRDLWAAWDAHRRLPTRGEGGMPATIAEGYAVQAALVQASGLPQCGWKIGATNAGAREMLGVDGPFYGVLLDTLSSDSPSRFAASGMFQRVVEPEIALQIDVDLDPSAAPFDAAAIRRAVRAVLPAIEIVDTPLAAGLKSGGPSLIADGGAHGRWIKGAPAAGWRDLDLIAHRVTLAVDGAVVREGSGGNVEGGPFAATAWLANALAAAGSGLKAGDYVTTGTTTQPVPAAAGQTVLADFGALGTVEIRFD